MNNILALYNYLYLKYKVWKSHSTVEDVDNYNADKIVGMCDLLEGDEYIRCVEWSELQKIKENK